jgi:hypothetical protein
MYQHGRRTRRPKNTSIFAATFFVATILMVVSWWFVRSDISSSTERKSTVPILTEIADDEDTVLITKNYFTLELPSDWKPLEERNDRTAHFYSWRSSKKGGEDRTLTLHVDSMPANYKLNRLLPVTPNQNRLTVGTLSDDCVNFTGSASRPAGQSNNPFDAKWENITFTCDPIVTNQTIGTATANNGIRTTMSGNAYFFFYEDHNIYPDDQIFINIVKSFVAK